MDVAKNKEGEASHVHQQIRHEITDAYKRLPQQ